MNSLRQRVARGAIEFALSAAMAGCAGSPNGFGPGDAGDANNAGDAAINGGDVTPGDSAPEGDRGPSRGDEFGCGNGDVDCRSPTATPCTTGTECADGLCIDAVTYPFAGGYCSGACAADTDCTGGGHCASHPAYPPGDFCALTCTATVICRTGYACSDADGDGRNECVPACPDDNACPGAAAPVCDAITGACRDCQSDIECIRATVATPRCRGGICVQCTAAADCSGGKDCVDNTCQTVSTVRMRIVAANLTSGNLQSYDPGHGNRILQGVAPDIVLVQEMNYGSNSRGDLRTWIDNVFGPGFAYFREPGSLQIPNGIISRWPVIASGAWNDSQVGNRNFAWARIDIPGMIDLWAVSVHFLTSSSGSRNAEAGALVNYIQTNVPLGDYLVIGGDMNTSSSSESVFSTLSAVVYTGTPSPADQNANRNTNHNRNKPYDQVLVDNDLRARQTTVVIGNSSFSAGVVIDTRVYTPLSEISPANSGDSGASNMQHMAVVKDFLVGAP